MLDTLTVAAIWLGLAVIATILANKAKVSMALMEIIIGVAAGYIATQYFEPGILQPNADWLAFIASSGAILLTFLSGLELDPATVRKKTKEITIVGLIGFFAPLLG